MELDEIRVELCEFIGRYIWWYFAHTWLMGCFFRKGKLVRHVFTVMIRFCEWKLVRYKSRWKMWFWYDSRWKCGLDVDLCWNDGLMLFENLVKMHLCGGSCVVVLVCSC